MIERYFSFNIFKLLKQLFRISRAIHPAQFQLYNNPAAMSQLERDRLGIPPHHVGLDPSDPMVSPVKLRPKKKQKTNPSPKY